VKTADKAAIAFFGVVFVGCGLSLLLPAVQTGQISRGVLGSLQIPAWSLALVCMVLSALIITYLTVNHIRHRK
jgi:energy-converting hydrogenase Eha subunit A